MSRVIRIIPQDFQLIVLENGYEIGRFSIATARYTWAPKFWSNDYRNPAGSYKVAATHAKGSEFLEELNTHFVPWYLSPTASNPHEDAGKNIYGVGMITTDYPNSQDLMRYDKAKRTGELLKQWRFFCENHLLPVYKYISVSQGLPFAEVKVETDYGNRTYQDLLESFAIQDPKIAFQLGVAIHGTSDPECIGTAISAGCIRMHNDDITKLMTMIEVGTEIEFDETAFYSM
jgi:L,D-transpeptidase-like protein